VEVWVIGALELGTGLPMVNEHFSMAVIKQAVLVHAHSYSPSLAERCFRRFMSVEAARELEEKAGRPARCRTQWVRHNECGYAEAITPRDWQRNRWAAGGDAIRH